MTEEIWKPVESYEDFYEVSNLGRVRSLTRRIWREHSNLGGHYVTYKGKILKAGKGAVKKDNKTYYTLRVELLNGGKSTRKSFGIGNLVTTTFIPNPDSLSEVCHIDGDYTNNKVENLKWYKSNPEYMIQSNKETKLHERIRKERGKKIRCIETSIIYDSIRQACKELDINRGQMNKHLNHDKNYSHIRQYHFEYV